MKHHDEVSGERRFADPVDDEPRRHGEVVGALGEREGERAARRVRRERDITVGEEKPLGLRLGGRDGERVGLSEPTFGSARTWWTRKRGSWAARWSRIVAVPSTDRSSTTAT